MGRHHVLVAALSVPSVVTSRHARLGAEENNNNNCSVNFYSFLLHCISSLQL